MTKGQSRVVVTEEEVYSPGAVDNALRLLASFLYQRVLAEMGRRTEMGSTEPCTHPGLEESAERARSSIEAATDVPDKKD